MTCYLFYVDESYDDEKFCLSALWVKHRHWSRCLKLLKEHRKELKVKYGIPPRKEIHASDLLAGRGELAEIPINKWDRSRIFLSMLRCVKGLPEVQLINICLDRENHEDAYYAAWERLINRIERSLSAWEETEGRIRQELLGHLTACDFESRRYEELSRRLSTFVPRALVVSDEGKEAQVTKMLRKMRYHNLIPSAFGKWEDGSTVKNIRVSRIIEDPIFRNSESSYFLQAIDCVAFALLKSETQTGPFNIHKWFGRTLAGSCFTKASRSDPLGIVRT